MSRVRFQPPKGFLSVTLTIFLLVGVALAASWGNWLLVAAGLLLALGGCLQDADSPRRDPPGPTSQDPLP